VTTSEAPRFRRYAAEERAAMLVQAGLACLAEGGITAFTVDNICRKAKASRGLIAHHFGSKDNLLAAVYEAAYAPMLARIAPAACPVALGPLIDVIFDAEAHDPATLRVWLALWGEIAVSQVLRAAHRRNYGLYRTTVEAAIKTHCDGQGLDLDAGGLAASVIALVDGLWLEQCIDPEGFDTARARSACLSMLEPLLGPLGTDCPVRSA
jgi:TetR/AcrR family transcriptional regulator, transcriptional repressor of bet genes